MWKKAGENSNWACVILIVSRRCSVCDVQWSIDLNRGERHTIPSVFSTVTRCGQESTDKTTRIKEKSSSHPAYYSLGAVANRANTFETLGSLKHNRKNMWWTIGVLPFEFCPGVNWQQACRFETKTSLPECECGVLKSGIFSSGTLDDVPEEQMPDLVFFTNESPDGKIHGI